MYQKSWNLIKITGIIVLLTFSHSCFLWENLLEQKKYILSLIRSLHTLSP